MKPDATVRESMHWNLALNCSAKTPHEKVEWMVRQMLGQHAVAEGRVRQSEMPKHLMQLHPHCRPDLMEQHYLVHTRNVELLNAMLHKCRHANERPGRMLLRLLLDAGSEHILHCILWDSLCQPGQEIGPAVAEAMSRSHDSPQRAKQYFAALCKASPNRGWGILGYNVIHDKLAIFCTGELVNMLVWPVVPLLVCDLWEHAYQLQYGPNRRAWVDASLRLADWRAVERRYLSASASRQEVLRRA